MQIAHFNRIKRKRRVLTRHHILPRSKGGGNGKHNLLLLWSDKHEAFNTLFGSSATIDEAISILQRLKQAKAGT